MFGVEKKCVLQKVESPQILKSPFIWKELHYEKIKANTLCFYWVLHEVLSKHSYYVSPLATRWIKRCSFEIEEQPKFSMCSIWSNKCLQKQFFYLSYENWTGVESFSISKNDLKIQFFVYIRANFFEHHPDAIDLF